jgi:hypothetical protein
MNFSEILKELWQRSEGETVFLPMRDGPTWYEPDGLSPPVAVATVNWMLTAPQQVDYYFTPLKYYGRRRRDNLGWPGVIFADLDYYLHFKGGGAAAIPLVPSLLIETSPGHMHGYWYLDDPVSPEVWDPKAREWSRQIGADPGGWDATQVLRLPGTPNMKYEATTVRLVEHNPGVSYSIDDFPEPSKSPDVSTPALPGMPLTASQSRLNLVAKNWDGLPLSSRYYLTMTKEEFRHAAITDRSEMVWGLILTLLEAGFSTQVIFGMMHGAPWDKYVTRPGVLWNTITKATVYWA